MSYSNQANRLMSLVKNLENKYNRNEILYNNAVKLVSNYHSEINQHASNAKVTHANKKLAKMNLAVVKQNGTVNFPVRVWDKYMNAAEQAVQKAINKPTPQNITVAQNKINEVTNNQNKIENIVNKPTNIVPVPNAPKPPNTPKNIVPVPNAPKPPNTPANNGPTGCDKYGFSALPNRTAIMKSFAKIANSNHTNKGGMGKIDMSELVGCKDEAIANLPIKPPNKPPNAPKPRLNINSLKRRVNSRNNKPTNQFRGPAPKPAMSMANQLQAARGGLKKTGAGAANKFRKNVPRPANRFRGMVGQVKAQKPAVSGNKFRGLVGRAKSQKPPNRKVKAPVMGPAPKPPNRKVKAPVMGPAPKPTMSMANQLQAARGGLKKTGTGAANKFRKNVPKPANRFRGAVSRVQAAPAGPKMTRQLPARSPPVARAPKMGRQLPARKPAMSMANQLQAARGGLKKTGTSAAPQFRRNAPAGRGATKFRGAVRATQASRRFR